MPNGHRIGSADATPYGGTSAPAPSRSRQGFRAMFPPGWQHVRRGKRGLPPHPPLAAPPRVSLPWIAFAILLTLAGGNDSFHAPIERLAMFGHI